MFMQTIALLAEERGWGTCMQECWARLRVELHDHFGLNENHMVYSGMSIGIPDPGQSGQRHLCRPAGARKIKFRGLSGAGKWGRDWLLVLEQLRPSQCWRLRR